VRDRLDRLEEAAQVIRALTSGPEPASFEGKHLRLQNAYANPKPAQTPLPLLVGGSGEKRTLAIAARYANEWNMGGTPIPAYREKVKALEAHCEREGRDPATITRSLMCAYVTAPTEAAVRQRYDALIDRLPEFMRPRGTGLAGLPWLIGTPAQIVEQIQEIEAEGVSRIMLQHREPPDFADMELVSKEILPKV
jgi:alkanesulfonate monooxygenase SsuD/methylene tetrahydromethanopterin reductase-like flavin-dependent oxidoreductase (luciferase family)